MLKELNNTNEYLSILRITIL